MILWLSNKAMSLSVLATLFISGMAASASANWQASNSGDGFISASACAPASSRLCVSLQCLAIDGGGVYWYINAPEPGYSAESTTVRWVIDRRRLPPLQMNKAGPSDNGMQSYEAVFDPVGHERLVELLKAGNRLTVSSNQFAAFTVSLRGSGTALSKVLAECPLTNGAEQDLRSAPSSAHTINETMSEAVVEAVGIERGEVPYPALIIPALNEFAEVCQVANRDDVFVPNALTSKDINGDGKPDYILNLGELSCGGGMNFFCGAQMCEFDVYISHGNGYISERYLGYGAQFGEDAILSPCPGGDTFSTIRADNGRLSRVDC